MSDRKEQPRLDGWVAWQDDPDPDSGVTIGIKDGYGYLNVAQEVPGYYVPLLLAAPDLLAALKKMRATMYSDKSEESVLADAAIAKAEGE